MNTAQIARRDAPGGNGLHRLAVTSDQQLERCLATLTRAQRQRFLAERDVWGNTPLHLAAANKRGEHHVASMLAAGASAVAVGPFGMLPRHAAEWAGCVAAAAAIGARDGQAPLSNAWNEVSERTFLALVCGVQRSTVIDERVVQLRSVPSFAAYPRLAAYLRAFLALPASAAHIDAASARAMVDALRNAAPCTMPPREQRRAAILRGQLTVVASGWRGHSVSYVFAWPYVVRANRLNWLTSGTWHVLKLCEPQHLDDVLQTLERNPLRHPAHAWLCEKRLQWESRPGRGDPIKKRLDAIPLKAQRLTNCSVASAKASVLAMFVLHAQNRPGMDPYELYKSYTTFLRFAALLDFVHPATRQRCGPPDAALVKECAAHILRADRARRMPNTQWLAQARAL